MDKVNSEIEISRSLSAAQRELDGAFVVTDDNVGRLYAPLLEHAAKTVVIKHGEDSKTLATVETLLREAAKFGLDRKSAIVALGGGVVGDIVGFAAAIYMRGIEWINIPTTLLAQLDSSIGGKTGVDLDDYKNMVGAFWLPKRVVVCTDFLKTLPQREVLCGLGEGYKSALLDREASAAWEKISRDADFENRDFFELVSSCARFKERVTTADFKEGSLRKILNLGHTVGHALEYLDRHRLSHGEYVSVGLSAEAWLGLTRGVLKQKTYEEITFGARKLAEDFDRLKNGFDGAAVAAAAKSDKKNRSGKISVIVSENFEQSELMFTENELKEEIDRWRSAL